MEENIKNGGGLSIGTIWFLIKKYFLLMVVIVVLSAGTGYMIARMRTPEYTISETVNFKTMNGETNTSSAINVQFAYAQTVIDFCKTGKVMDRANFYYNEYLNSNYTNVDDYIKSVNDRLTDYVNPINGYLIEKCVDSEYSVEKLEGAVKYFNSGNVSSTTVDSKNTQTTFKITIKKTAKENLDEDYEDIKARIKIYVMACDIEARDSFGDGNSYIIPINLDRMYSNISKRQTTMYAGIIGVVLAVAVVFILYLLDTTIKDSETLVKITGTNVLAFIADQEEK
ncbi:MAG: hypothetical protein MJ066_00365 [Clostridia bacterium]|nr:hypothetical protein [Clostridia bacterium]